MKKRYVHIKEYDLTKKILDALDLDVEDEDVIYMGVSMLTYKKRSLCLVPYSEMSKFNDDDKLPFRPVTNTNHSNYLINLFSDKYDCETLFEYGNMEEKGMEEYLQGKIKLTYDSKNKKDRTVYFYGVKNVNVLQAALILRMLCKSKDFDKLIKHLKKVDEVLSKKKAVKS